MDALTAACEDFDTLVVDMHALSALNAALHVLHVLHVPLTLDLAVAYCDALERMAHCTLGSLHSVRQEIAIAKHTLTPNSQ